MMQKPLTKGWKPVFANDTTALNPTIWSKFGLSILESTMVAGHLVYRDFENELREYGDTVNTRRPLNFTAIRKTDDDSITLQDAKLKNIPVVLNQRPHVSFLIPDGAASLAMSDLIRLFLAPAMTAMAEQVDAIVLGQYAHFLNNTTTIATKANGVGGALLGMTSSNAKQFFLETGQRLDESKCPAADRTMIVSPNMKNLILQNAIFTEAQKRGDDGMALREAHLGRILGFDAFMCQNMASILVGNTVRSFEINSSSTGYNIGDSALTIDTGTGEITVGTWVAIGGIPYQVTARTGTAPTTAITVKPALLKAAAENDKVTVYTPGDIDQTATTPSGGTNGYDAGWSKEITCSVFTVAPQPGQIVTFGGTGGLNNIYTIVRSLNGPTITKIMLDRPLVAAIADADAVNIGPAGDYGMAFTRNSVALVCRPLALPRQGVGVIAGAAEHNGFSMRATIGYDVYKQGHVVTLDLLLGLAIFDPNCGAVMLG